VLISRDEKKDFSQVHVVSLVINLSRGLRRKGSGCEVHTLSILNVNPDDSNERWHKVSVSKVPLANPVGVLPRLCSRGLLIKKPLASDVDIAFYAALWPSYRSAS
jgi:hypothetical protein